MQLANVNYGVSALLGQKYTGIDRANPRGGVRVSARRVVLQAAF